MKLFRLTMILEGSMVNAYLSSPIGREESLLIASIHAAFVDTDESREQLWSFLQDGLLRAIKDNSFIELSDDDIEFCWEEAPREH